MVRLLPKSDIGVWSLYMSIATMLELLRNGFIRNPLIANAVTAQNMEERNSVVAASWVLHFGLAVISSLLLFFLAAPLSGFWEAPQLEGLFYIYILRGLILVPALHFEYLLQSEVNFKAIFFSNLARLAPTSLYITVKYIDVVFFDGVAPDLFDIAVVQVLSAAASLWIGHYSLRNAQVFRWRTDRTAIETLSHFGKYTLGTTISSMLIKNTDSWMIGRMISLDAVASYNPALRISNLIEVPTLAVASVVFPHVPRKWQANGSEALQDIYVKSVSLILAMMLPFLIPLYFFSDLVIRLIFTAQYMEASPILKVTIFFMLLIPFNRQFGTLMDGLKNPKLNFYLLIAMGIINVVTNYFLIKDHGAIGAAFGTLLAYSVIMVVNQIVLYHRYGINTIKVFPSIFHWYRTWWVVFKKKVLRIA